MRFRAGLTITIAALVCLFLDTAVFAHFNFSDIRPDMLIALAVALGIVLDSAHAGLVCGGIGLLNDILFSKMLGVGAAVYFVAGMVAGSFSNKFYVRNLVFPAVLAAALAFLKDNVYAVTAALSGARFNYALMLVSYILPCALFTGLMCVPVCLCLKPMLSRYGRYLAERADMYT